MHTHEKDSGYWHGLFSKFAICKFSKVYLGVVCIEQKKTTQKLNVFVRACYGKSCTYELSEFVRDWVIATEKYWGGAWAGK